MLSPFFQVFATRARRCALLVSAILAVASCQAGEQLLHNGSFDKGRDGWYLFVPSASAASECHYVFTDAGPQNSTAIEMSSAAFARYAFSSTEAITVQAGKPYRIGAWVKADAGMTVETDTPGLVMRILCKDAGGQDAKPGQHLYVGLDEQVELSVGPPANIQTSELPVEWTHMQAVVEFPAGTSQVNVQLTCIKTQGKVSWSDVTFEAVDDDTPLTPVLGKKKERR